MMISSVGKKPIKPPSLIRAKISKNGNASNNINRSWGIRLH